MPTLMITAKIDLPDGTFQTAEALVAAKPIIDGLIANVDGRGSVTYAVIEGCAASEPEPAPQAKRKRAYVRRLPAGGAAASEGAEA